MNLFYLGDTPAFQFLERYLQAENQRRSESGAQLFQLLRVVDQKQLTKVESPLCVLSDSEPEVSALVTVWIHDSPPTEDVSEAHYHVWMGGGESAQVHQLLRHIELIQERHRVFEIVSSPLSHDIRGALGVVGLVTEVLKQNEQAAPVLSKLKAASLKLETLLKDLQLLTVPGLLISKSPEKMANLQKHEGPISAQSVLAKLSEWFSASHRGRELELAPETAELKTAPLGMEQILRGLLDAAARLSARESLVNLSYPRSGLLKVRVHPVALSPLQAGDLSQFGPHVILETDPHTLPFRLGLSLAAARANGANVSADLKENALELDYLF